MGPLGREAKLTQTSPTHPGEVGVVINIACKSLFIRFSDGTCEWVLNKFIYGLRDQEPYK